jgi:hypothetical protein
MLLCGNTRAATEHLPARLLPAHGAIPHSGFGLRRDFPFLDKCLVIVAYLRLLFCFCIAISSTAVHCLAGRAFVGVTVGREPSRISSRGAGDEGWAIYQIFTMCGEPQTIQTDSKHYMTPADAAEAGYAAIVSMRNGSAAASAEF